MRANIQQEYLHIFTNGFGVVLSQVFLWVNQGSQVCLLGPPGTFHAAPGFFKAQEES